MSLTVKLITPHSQFCPYRRGDYRGESPWYFNTFSPGLRHEYRDAIGRKQKHSGRRWIEANCNDLGCKARCVVRLDTIEMLIPPML